MHDPVESTTPTYNSLLKNLDPSHQGLYIGTPCTGNVRIEWCLARFGQVIPCNWGFKQAIQYLPTSAPLGYLVAEAQNLIVRDFLASNTEWLLFIEQDNVIPPDCFLRLNDYIRSKEVPIVSGLYFTKSQPAEPLVYRGRGTGYFDDWKIGDQVWVDAVPTGTLLVHRSIMQTLWDESEEYVSGNPGQKTRRVFQQPERVWYDPEKGWDNSTGTSDMEFCSRCIIDRIFEKAGWSKYQAMPYPFLIDTNIFVNHIDDAGRVFPSQQEKQMWSIAKAERRGIVT